MKTSETITIKRSQIRLNPCNPKRHTDKQIAKQKANLKKVGFLGGIVWNRRTGNLIDGHRRVMALDIINHYDGESHDYDIKVEACDLSEKEEKSQLTYMALGNTKADYALVAEYISDVDYDLAGLDNYDIQQIQAYIPTAADVPVTNLDDLITPTTDEQPAQGEEASTQADAPTSQTEGSTPTTAAEKKAAVKEAKEAAREKAVKNFKDLNAYITISFADAEQKRIFCDLAGIGEDDKFITGEAVLEMIS